MDRRGFLRVLAGGIVVAAAAPAAAYDVAPIVEPLQVPNHIHGAVGAGEYTFSVYAKPLTGGKWARYIMPVSAERARLLQEHDHSALMACLQQFGFHNGAVMQHLQLERAPIPTAYASSESRTNLMRYSAVPRWQRPGGR